MNLINKYKVELDVFAGPLDLLLHLIKKNEVDIYDIPISTITDKYLEYIELIKSLNLDLAGEFLVMAATLTHIKSKMLLPIPEMEEEEEEGPDPREELMRRLILYRMFKEASIELIERQVLGRDVFRRGMPVTLDDIQDSSVEEEELAIDSTIFDLMDAFKDVLKRFPKNYTLDLTVERFRLTDKINEIMEKISADKSVVFEELFPIDATKGEVIVTFLAVLELAKSLLVKVFQGDEGVIRLYGSGDETRKVDIVNDNIEEYTGGGYNEEEVFTERDPEKALEEELEKEIEAELDSELGAKPGEELDIESLEAKARELIEEDLAKEAREAKEAQEQEINRVSEGEQEAGSPTDSDASSDSSNDEEETDNTLETDASNDSEEDVAGEIEEEVETGSLEDEQFATEQPAIEEPESGTAEEENVTEEVAEEVVEEAVSVEGDVDNENFEDVEEDINELEDSEVKVEKEVVETETQNDLEEEIKDEQAEPEQSATEQSATEQSATEQVEPKQSEPEESEPEEAKPEQASPEQVAAIDSLVAELESDKLKGIESIESSRDAAGDIAVEEGETPDESPDKTIDKPIEAEAVVEPEPSRSVFGAMWNAVTKVTKKIVNIFRGRGRE